MHNIDECLCFFVWHAYSIVLHFWLLRIAKGVPLVKSTIQEAVQAVQAVQVVQIVQKHPARVESREPKQVGRHFAENVDNWKFSIFLIDWGETELLYFQRQTGHWQRARLGLKVIYKKVREVSKKFIQFCTGSIQLVSRKITYTNEI